MIRAKHREDVPALRKVLNKILRFQVTRQDSQEEIMQAKANAYRTLSNFHTTLENALDDLSKELSEAKVKVDFKFPDHKERVYIGTVDYGPEMVLKWAVVENYE